MKFAARSRESRLGRRRRAGGHLLAGRGGSWLAAAGTACGPSSGKQGRRRGPAYQAPRSSRGRRRPRHRWYSTLTARGSTGVPGPATRTRGATHWRRGLSSARAPVAAADRCCPRWRWCSGAAARQSGAAFLDASINLVFDEKARCGESWRCSATKAQKGCGSVGCFLVGLQARVRACVCGQPLAVFLSV